MGLGLRGFLARREQTPASFDDGTQIAAYAAAWETYQSAHFGEIVQLAGAWLGASANDSNTASNSATKFSILHYGSASGALFRALQEGLGHLCDFDFHAVDPDVRALAFLKAKLPSAHIQHADLDSFLEKQCRSPVTADLAIVALHCYALEEASVAKLLAALALTAPRLIIADQVENAEGASSIVMTLKDWTGRDYDASCHPFGKMVKQAGWSGHRVFSTSMAVKSISGFVAAGSVETLRQLDSHARLVRTGRLEGIVPSAEGEGAPALLAVSTLLDYLAGDKLSAMDVGAAGGVHPLWRPFSQIIEVDAFEPDARACEAAQTTSEPNVHWHPVALDRHTGMKQFHLLVAPTGSSFYPPNDEVQRFLNTSKYRAIDRTFNVETWSVADFLRRKGRPVPNLIKLDTQGSELDILSSLDETSWQDVLAIETEVEFIEVYKDQPQFAELDGFLKSKGMLLFDLRTAREYCAANDIDQFYMRTHLNFAVGRNDMSARLYAGDALYFRDFCTAQLPSKSFVMKMIATLLIYSYYDYALFLCDRGLAANLLSPDEHNNLFSQIVAAAPRPKRWQRADAEGLAARNARANSEWTDHIYRAFWQVRSWPNQ